MALGLDRISVDFFVSCGAEGEIEGCLGFAATPLRQAQGRNDASSERVLLLRLE